jgi:hypothetical protein
MVSTGIDMYAVNIFAELEMDRLYEVTKRLSRLSATVITLFPVPPIKQHQQTREKRKKENEI